MSRTSAASGKPSTIDLSRGQSITASVPSNSSASVNCSAASVVLPDPLGPTIAPICQSSLCFVGYWNDEPVTFVAVLHQPSRQTKNFKRVSRLVTLPAYQGLGIGTGVLSEVADLFRSRGNRITIVTSHPGLMRALNSLGMWRCTRGISRISRQEGLPDMNKTTSSRRETATFEYDGGRK